MKRQGLIFSTLMKKILVLILILSASIPFYAKNVNWQLHPIFDEEVTHVAETPDYVYFTSRNMAKNKWNEAFLSLFRYDKKGDELMPLSATGILNGHSIRDVVYNPGKGYLAVLYKDYNLDLIDRKGKVTNIPYYGRSDMDYDMTVTSMTLDAANDRLYLATAFGYVAVNDKKNEIAESRIYGEPLQGMARLGDWYFILKGNELLRAPSSSPRLSLKDYEITAILESPQKFFPLSDNFAVVITGEGNTKTIKGVRQNSEGVEVTDLFRGDVINAEYTQEGLSVTTYEKLYQLKADGSFTYIDIPPMFRGASLVTENMRDIWAATKRKGLAEFKVSGDQWSLTRDYMLPNAPSPYASTSFINHPELGLLVLNYGYRPQTVGLNEGIPFQLSSYKNGRWRNHSPAYTNPDRTEIMLMTNGMALDPDNPDYLYVTSVHNGIVRLNLKDPFDIIHMSRENDSDKGNNGFITLVKTSTFLPYFANFSAPWFDAKGNMWMNYANWDDQASPNPHLYCYTAEDRRATTSTTNIRLPKEVEVDAEVPLANSSFVVPILKTGNGLLTHARGLYDESLTIVDTNGTPLDTGDDRIYKFPYFRDSDGNNVEIHDIRQLWEDPSTGYVWIAHANGVCYFVPSRILSGNYEVNRIKVARNDGTNLADYLLEGVPVNQIVTDSEGRKWFATGGAGVICTTPSGREIIEEFNTSNSPLPDDVAYGIGYDNSANSMMISTAQGFAEYKLPASLSSGSKTDVKAYPNPVRPEFSGYVTITDIPEGSLVKITDVAGNLVKELGLINGFEILWDLSDSRHNRVKSGVYHIMVSPMGEDGKYSTVGKILVVS